ncbi:MAG TPA: tetratricopeptide repeat protein, partial [Aquabacterium sp.]|nr:tetratricopeptide repeat protein [Aquabacterium sp.]
MALFKFFQSKKPTTGPAQPEVAATPSPAPAVAQNPAPSPSTPSPPPAPKLAPGGLPSVNMNIRVSYGQPSINWSVTPTQAPPPAVESAATLFERAQVLHKQGQLALARPVYEQLLQLEPEHANGLHYLGLLQVQQGQLAQGIEFIERSLQINPQQFAALGNLAGALQEVGRLEEAVARLDEALTLKPDVAELWFNRGNMLMSLNRPEDAASSFRQALEYNPKLAAAANHLGVVLTQLGRFEEALSAADQALAVAPQLADAHDTRGSALRHLQRHAEALTSYERALALQPQQLSYLANRCSVLEDMDRYEEAIVALRQIRQMDPDFKCVKGRLLHAQRRCLDWTNLSQLTDQVVNDTLAGRLSDAPLNMLAVSDRAAVQLACARQAMADHPSVQRTPLPRRQLGVHDKIRIAYVSADLREHAVSYLMAGVFEHHDRSQFEITAISLNPPQDSPMGHRVQAAFDHFVDVSQWTDDRIVHHMRQHGYDIAVDLMGLTFGARPGIWAQGIAPIQISYLGYPGTTGAPYMDYILADTTVIPP